MSRLAAPAAALVLIVGCASVDMPAAPPVALTAAAPALMSIAAPSDPPLRSEELRWRERAAALAQEGRYAEAATQWELLVLLRPADPDYLQSLLDTRGQIAKLALERQARATEARQRNDIEQAVLWHLKTLAVDPDHVGANEALRVLDRERTIRTYVARAGRGLGGPNAVAKFLFPNAMSSGAASLPGGEAVKPAPPKPAPTVAMPDDLDAGIMLYRQSEFAAGIESLRRHLQRNPQDAVARRYLGDAYIGLAQRSVLQGNKESALAWYEKAQTELDTADHAVTIRALRLSLAEEYYQRGVRNYHVDLRESITLLERSLQFDPGHAQAALRLQQARATQRTLESIGKKTAKP